MFPGIRESWDTSSRYATPQNVFKSISFSKSDSFVSEGDYPLCDKNITFYCCFHNYPMGEAVAAS